MRLIGCIWWRITQGFIEGAKEALWRRLGACQRARLSAGRDTRQVTLKSPRRSGEGGANDIFALERTGVFVSRTKGRLNDPYLDASFS